MFRSQNPVGRAQRMEHHTPAEWLAMVEDPAFGALVSRKRRYLFSSWLLVVSSYLMLAFSASLAPDAFAEPLMGELNLGLVLVIGEMLLCLLVAWLYVGRAGPQFDRDAEALAMRFRFRLSGPDVNDPAAE